AVAARGDAPPPRDRDVPAGRADPAQRPPVDTAPPQTGLHTMSTVPLFRNDWTPDAWRARPVAQQPDWPDVAELDAVLGELRRQPPLVFAGEARSLSEQLAAAAEGQA